MFYFFMIHEIRSKADFEKLRGLSESKPVFLLKHSLTCPVSGRAFDVFQKFYESHNDGFVEFFLLKIQTNHEISNFVAQETGVEHESPQVLLFFGSDVVWHDSHYLITDESLGSALDSVLRNALS